MLKIKAGWGDRHPGYLFCCDEQLCLEIYLYVNDNQTDALSETDEAIPEVAISASSFLEDAMAAIASGRDPWHEDYSSWHSDSSPSVQRCAYPLPIRSAPRRMSRFLRERRRGRHDLDPSILTLFSPPS